MMNVLKNFSQIKDSRISLNLMGATYLNQPDTFFKSVLRRFGLVKNIVVGDYIKSWDILLTLQFIEENLKKDSSILDIGSYASEILISLHKLGYKNLSGADLNPNLVNMPFQDYINYDVQNFMKTTYESGSFDLITAISVIEHGFNRDDLLKEISRLLKPGGYFIASFDYAAKKIDTSGIKMFGMNWNIFSENEILELIKQGNVYNLDICGDLDFQCQEMPIKCAGKDYTFGWLVLQKNK